MHEFQSGQCVGFPGLLALLSLGFGLRAAWLLGWATQNTPDRAAVNPLG